MRVFVTIFLFLFSTHAVSENAKPSTNPKKKSKSTNKKYDPVAILREAEKIRSVDDTELMVHLATKSGDGDTQYDLRVFRTSGRKAFVEFLAPEEEVGRFLLANGFRYWTTFPDSKRVFAISRKEAIGNSSFDFADIFQLDDEDYEPKLIGKTKTKSKKTELLQLELKARNEEVPYDKVHYWVREKDYFPMKATFFGVSGKELKQMHTLESKKLAGRIRPSKFEMRDSVNKTKISVWTTKTMRKKKVPQSVFTKSYLKSKK